MNLSFHFISIILIYLPLVSGQTCTKVFRRPEIRELTSIQLQRFLSAVLQLNKTQNNNFYTTSTSNHYNNVPAAHGVPAFLPWHRVFLRRYEQALQKIDSSIVLPYWDWSKDSQSPEKSPIFSPSYFGGNGRNSDYCVDNGPFKQFRVTVPNSHCLKRQFNGGSTIGSFYSPESLESILRKSTSFDLLRQSIEGGPHGTVHVSIGGNNGDMSYMYSPNDPIFYMHHAFVDLLWYEWQQRNPSLANTYNGRAGSVSVKSTDNLIPFNVQVQSTFNTRGSGYCYYYNRYSASSNLVAVVSVLSNKGVVSLPRQEAQDAIIQSDTIKAQIDTIVKNGEYKNSKNQVNAFDRSTRGKLRKPEPLPEAYIKANNLDITKVRKDEQEIGTLINALNAIPSFHPEVDIL